MARDRIKERMYNALCLAAMQFRRYEDHHHEVANQNLAKPDIKQMSEMKAETNRHFAELCEGAAEDSVE